MLFPILFLKKKGNKKDKTEINETENRRTVEKINETKRQLFGKFNKINKLQA